MIETLKVLVNGSYYEVVVQERQRNSVKFQIGERNYQVEIPLESPTSANTSSPLKAQTKSSAQSSGAVSQRAVVSHGGAVIQNPNEVRAPMPGVIVDVCVNVGVEVAPGDLLLHIEAMKMHNAICAPYAGRISAVHVQPGSEVKDLDLLIELTTS